MGMQSSNPGVQKTLLTKRLVRESPWLMGVVVGLIGLWWRGHAFVPLPYLSSYDWMEYVPSAWMVTHGLDMGGYATWRNPLYPAILGQVGEWWSYNDAAWLIASICMSLVVFSAGLGARALASPWAGFVAAVTVPTINPWAEASRWATLYPMLTATTGLTLACGAAFLRWGHPLFGAVGALSAGLALGVDFRGLAMVTFMVVLTLFVWHRHRRPGVAALAIALLVVGPALNQAKAVSHQKGTDTAVQTQRALEVKLAIESGDMDLVRACQSEPTDEAYPSLTALTRPCAWAFVRDNLDRFKDQAPFGVGLTLIALPLILLGDGRGWRASLNSLLVFGAGWGALFLMAIWARLNVHHFVQFAVPIAMVVPVAASRCLQSLSFARTQPLAQLLMAIVGTVWVWTAGPWAGKPVDDLATAEQNQLLGWMLAGVDMHIDLASGDQLLDCSGLGVEAALLPKRLNAGLPNFQTSATAERCTQWMQSSNNVTGRQWLITREEPGFSGPPAPPWIVVESWVDGPRRTWLWMRVDSRGGRP